MTPCDVAKTQPKIIGLDDFPQGQLEGIPKVPGVTLPEVVVLHRKRSQNPKSFTPDVPNIFAPPPPGDVLPKRP